METTTLTMAELQERGHWQFRVLALTREVSHRSDLLDNATAYRSGASEEEVTEHRDRLAMSRYLLEEARHHVASAS